VRIPTEAAAGIAKATLSYPKHATKVKDTTVEFRVP
jgi:hypothetical protein